MATKSKLDSAQTLQNSHDEANLAFRMIPVTSLIPAAYDYIAFAQTSTTDVWTMKSGGSAGVLVCTITITYTDSTKVTISSVART